MSCLTVVLRSHEYLINKIKKSFYYNEKFTKLILCYFDTHYYYSKFIIII